MRYRYRFGWMRLVLVVVLPSLLAHCAREQTPQEKLDAAIARWQALGGERDMMALAPAGPGAALEDQNAAALFEQAFRSLSDIDDQIRADISVVLRSGLPEMEPAMGLDPAVQSAMNLARQAVDRPACVWNTDLYTKHISAEQQFKLLDDSRLLTGFLAADALNLHEAGDAAAAMDNVRAILKLGECTVADPHLLNLVTGVLIDGTAVQLIDRLLAEGGQIPPDIRATFASRDYPAELRRAVLANSTMGMMIYDNPAMFDRVDVSQLTEPELLRDTLHFLAIIEQAVTALDQPYYQVRDIELVGPAPVAPSIADTIRPDWLHLYRMIAANMARLQLVEAAAKLREHKAAHGSYPDTFELPIDPGTGHTGTYELKDGTFTLLYLQDDGSIPIGWRWQ